MILLKSKRVLILLGLFLLILLKDPVMGQGKGPSAEPHLTIDQAVKQALEHNRQVINARLEIEKTTHQIEAAQKHFLPVFDIKLTESYLLTSSDYVFKQGAFGTYEGIGPIPAEETKIRSNKKWNTFLSATISQPISQLYRLQLGIEALELGKSIVQEKFQALRNTIKAETKRLYFGIVLSQGAKDAAREQIEALRELERVTFDLTDQQINLASDLLEVKARMAKAESESLSIRNQLVIAKQQLNNLMGRPLDEDFTVQYVPLPSVADIRFMDVRARAFKRRSEIKETRLKQRQAETEIRIKKAEYIPDVSILFNYLSPFDSEFLPRNIATIGVQLSWDVFDWGRKKQELAERTRTLEQAGNEIREVESLVALDVQSRLFKLQEAESLTKAGRLTKEASQEKLRIVLNRYRMKAALLQEVLQAQAALSESNHQYLNATLAYAAAQADFEKALGEEL
jgi:outer membrane protein